MGTGQLNTGLVETRNVLTGLLKRIRMPSSSDSVLLSHADCVVTFRSTCGPFVPLFFPPMLPCYLPSRSLHTSILSPQIIERRAE